MATTGASAEPAGPEFRAGAVAVLGRPNVGKSTLVNALVGQKVTITAPRPQTTRHRILGIVNDPAFQVVLIDTPGLHDAGRKHAINRVLNRTAQAASSEADAILLVVEAPRFGEADRAALSVARASGRPVVLAVNKIDQVKPRNRLLPFLARVAPEHGFAALLPVSAQSGDGVAELGRVLGALMPAGDALYPDDQASDRSERFLASELIREQVVRQLHDELPYSAAVVLEGWAEDGRGALRLEAAIYVEREAQKGIVVGAGGARIKAIGTAARRSLTAALGRPVHLQLWCKVRENWSDDEAALQRFGYGD